MSQHFTDRNSPSMRSLEELEMMESIEHIKHADQILTLTGDTQDDVSRGEAWADETYEERLGRKQQQYKDVYQSATDFEECSVDVKEDYQDRMSRLEHRMGFHDDELNRSADILALTAESSGGQHERYGNAATSVCHDQNAKKASSKAAGRPQAPQKTSSGLSHASASDAAYRRSQSASKLPPPRSKSDELSHSGSLDAPTRKRFSEDRDYKQRMSARMSRQLHGAATASTPATALRSSGSNMILRQPSLAYQQSSKVSNRPKSGLNVPGAYVVPGVNTGEIVEEEEHDFGSVGEASATQNEEDSIEPAEEPSHPPRVQEATIEQPRSAEKGAERRYRYWIIGIVIVVLIAIGTGVGVALSSGGSLEGSPTASSSNPGGSPVSSPPLDSPSPGPSIESCNLDSIYLQCQGEVDEPITIDIPDCAKESYDSLRESFLPEVDSTIEVDPTSCSPENLALLTLAVNNETSRNKFILNTFYFATNGHGWENSANWLSKEHERDWEGVVCFNTSDVVIGITLALNDLSGTIPTTIGLLDNLEKFELPDNALVSTIPEELANLKRLAILDLSFNSFERGPIPPYLLGLSNIVSVNLSRTQRTGALTKELLAESQVNGLYLNQNSLTGSIPSQLFSLPLIALQLSDNSLTGSIPTEIGLLSSVATGLLIGGNELTGTMPSEAGHLKSVVHFLFQSNRLAGFIPDEVCGLWVEGALEELGSTGCVGSTYGGLECPSAECCRNCPGVFEG